MRVLLVIEDPHVRASLGDLTAARGHLVSAHATTDEALAAFAGADYPLIVLGLGRSDETGLGFVRRLRSLPEGDQFVVLAILDQPERGDPDRLLLTGVDDVVLGPLERDRFALRLAFAERRVAELTERAHLLAARRADERLLRAVFSHSFDGLALADDAGRLIEANPAALDLLGVRDLTAASDHRLPDLLLPDDATQAAERWQILLREGALSGELRRPLADGDERTGSYRLTANVVPGRHLGVFRDMTAESRESSER
jgi:PAS domain S-box-containing protein